MKIKEKGLTGAKAQARRDTMAEGVGRRGFNAFREMANKGKSGEAREKPEVYLDFLGNRVRVYEGEDGRGTIKEEDVTIVNGVTLKFEGCGGDCLFEQVKVCRSHYRPLQTVITNFYGSIGTFEGALRPCPTYRLQTRRRPRLRRLR
jgi:hypothetical protein